MLDLLWHGELSVNQSCRQLAVTHTWLVLLYSTLVATAAVQAGAGGSSAAASECRLDIHGGRSSIEYATFQCTGASADVELHTLLDQFMSTFTGLANVSSCGGAPAPRTCVVTVCSGEVILRGSRVTGLPGQYRKGISWNAIVCLIGRSRLQAHSSEFSRNGATALACFDQSHLVLNNSSVHGNTGLWTGGLVAWDNATVIINSSSSVHSNTGGFTGGLDAWDNATVTINGSSSVHSNTGNHMGGLSVGHTGGLSVGHNATVTINGSSSVHSNTGILKGGLYAMGNATVTINGSSSVHSNTADFIGGLDAEGNAIVTITGSSSVHNNTGRSAGGLNARGNATVTINGSSTVHSNTGKVTGGLSVEHNATVTINGSSSVHSNTGNVTGGLGARGNATVTINGSSSVHSNTGNGMGGLGAWGNATVTINGSSSVHSNTGNVTGGLGAWRNATVTINGSSSVHSNTANNMGGLGAWDNTTVTINGSSSVHGNMALNGSGGGLFISDNSTVLISKASTISSNTCQNGLGGGIVVGLPLHIRIVVKDGGREVGVVRVNSSTRTHGSSFANVTISNSTITNNNSTLSAGVGGGLAVGGNATVTLKDGTCVEGNRAIDSSGGGAALTDRGTLVVERGVVIANNLVAKRSVGSTITTSAYTTLDLPVRGELTKCSDGVYLGWEVCRDGERLLNGKCMCCSAHTYSFTNASECKPCPANAKCWGGGSVEPIAGYWASFSRSEQMHRCPLFTSCTIGPWGSTCAEGYSGNLCGACQLPNYGMLSPLRCRKCMEKPAHQLGLYILLCVLTVIFVAYTVHTTWKDNLEGDQSVRATDIIKVLVQFLQYTLIIGSVQVPWPRFVNPSGWFHAASAVFGPASGQALSLDCWLYHYLPQAAGSLPLAIQRQLVYYLGPLLVFVGVVVLQCLCWVVWHKVVLLFWQRFVNDDPCRSSRQHVATQHAPFMVLRKLPVTVLVMGYFAFPTLVRASLGFFACFRIDRGKLEHWRVGDLGPLNHTMGYWVSDIQQECFVGYHKRWALSLGLLSMLLLCVAVPIAIGLGLWLNKSKANADSFREHFGFLYRNYRPECMWWEAVWAVQTVVLMSVSVFSFPMERYLSVLGLLLVFWASAGLQVFFQPYAMASLHKMHIVSTSCLAATTFGALAVFAYEIRDMPADVLRVVVVVIVLCVNVAFVLWCGFKLIPVAEPVWIAVSAWGLKACTACAPRVRGVVAGWIDLPPRRGKAHTTVV